MNIQTQQTNQYTQTRLICGSQCIHYYSPHSSCSLLSNIHVSIGSACVHSQHITKVLQRG